MSAVSRKFLRNIRMPSPLQSIFEAIATFLLHPLVLVHAVLINISQEASFFADLVLAGREITLPRVWVLARWSLLALFIFGLMVFLCIDTVKRVMFAESKQRNLKVLLSDIILTLLTLFVYYFMISIALFVFFNIVLPIYTTL